MYNFKILSAVFLFICSPSLLNASSIAPSSEYVSITVEINGLQESTSALNDAMVSLAATLNQISEQPENLSVEQLQEINVLVKQTNALSHSLKDTVNEVGLTIGNANQQVTQIVADAVEAARIKGIDPAVDSISRMVKSWLVLLIIGAVSILGVLGFVIYRTTKQFREVVKIAKMITDEYEIVRRTE